MTPAAMPGLPKYRVLIPLPYEISGAESGSDSGSDWLIRQRRLNDHFLEEGVMPDRTIQTAGQPCHLPNRGSYYFSRSRREDVKCMRGIVAAEMAQKAAKQLPRALGRASKTVDPSERLIRAFNHAYVIGEFSFEASYDAQSGKSRHPSSQLGGFSARIRASRVYTSLTSDPFYTDADGTFNAFSMFTVRVADGDLRPIQSPITSGESLS